MFETVETFKRKAHALGFNKGYKHYAKYSELYNFIKDRKPKFVLELGSGVTTLVALQAFKEVGSGTLISIDEDDYFGGTVKKIADEMFPGASWEMHIIPAVTGKYKDFIGTHYESLPDHPYDLVFVDGPQTEHVDLDVFYILEKNPDTPVIIDVRHDTVNALRTLYPSTRFSYFKNLGFVNL